MTSDQTQDQLTATPPSPPAATTPADPIAASHTPSLSFSKALELLLEGRRLAADFMPESIYIELQVPDAGSMNTEPYLKMVRIGINNRIDSCEPWEPGRRSLFSSGWYVSKFDALSPPASTLS